MYKSLFVYILKYTYDFHISPTVLNFAAGEGSKRSAGSIVWERKYCTESRTREIQYLTFSTKKGGYWFGHILCRNCILKQVIEGKREVRIEVMGRQGRRRKQQLGDIKEISGYWKLKKREYWILLSVENSFWKRLGTCCKAECGMNEWMDK